MWWLHIVNVCFISLFFDEENTDHTLQLTLGLTTIKIKEMFWLLQIIIIIIIIIINEFHERDAYFLLKYLVRVGVVNSRLRVFFPFLVCLFWQGTISEQGQLCKEFESIFSSFTTKPPALVFSEARRLSWPKLDIFTPFDTAMFALPDRPYFRTRPFMIRIWDHCLQ